MGAIATKNISASIAFDVFQARKDFVPQQALIWAIITLTRPLFFASI
jgi:hypothetical protein